MPYTPATYPATDVRSFDTMIGRLDRLLSEFLLAAEGPLDGPDFQTIKHHAEDLIGVGNAALKRLHAFDRQDINAYRETNPTPQTTDTPKPASELPGDGNSSLNARAENWAEQDRRAARARIGGAEFSGPYVKP